MKNRDVPDPFKTARRIPGIHVMLKPSDITDVCSSLSVEAAQRLMEEYGQIIAAHMLIAGASAAIEISKREAAG